MKKGLCLISVMLIVSSLLGSYLDETKTMDATLFGNLYDAIDFDSGHDEVMRFYWNKWMESANPNPTTRYEGENECREDRATYDPINWSYTYSKNSLIGALAVDMNDILAEQYLDNVQDHLIYNPYSAHDNYLKLFSDYVGEESVFGQDIDGDGIWEDGEYSDGSWADCLSYSSMLNSVANIVDNLWYYNVSNQTDLYTKLEELAGWANELLSESNFSGGYAYCTNIDYPPRLWTAYHNGRIRLAGALGYAGCVLGNEEFIETAENDLFVRSLPGGKNGSIEFMTSNSGTYNEGISYAEYTFEGLAKFFTARKRLTFDFSNIPDNNNWFEDDRVRDIYVNSLDLISPSMANVPFDDVHETYMQNWGTTNYGYLYKPRKMFSECITYYYQSPSSETDSRDHIKWLVNNYKSHTGYANYYTTGWNTNKFYVYKYDANRILAGMGSTPVHLTGGIYSNEELTILRRPIQNYDDYLDYPVLFINHENSPGNSGHEHSDQSSFILYYKDKQLLIDPGYRPSWYSYSLGKEWLASPYAHNVIMVNPYDEYYNAYSSSDFNLIEENELNGDYRDLFTSFDEWNDPEDNNPNHIKFKFLNFEPIGDAGDFSDINPLNPAYKSYLISNGYTAHLQIELDYDHPQEYYPTNLSNDVINIKRNFYSVDLESETPYFIIYDDLTSSDHSIENEFMNQLHFALYPVPNNNNEFPNNPDNINDPSIANGQFSYSHFENTLYLHGAMGSNGNSEYSIRDTLPQGLYYGYDWDNNLEPPQWMHKCMRTKTCSENDVQFLTLLIPSESSTNPIDPDYISNQNGFYAVRYNLHPGYDCYVAVKSEAYNSFYYLPPSAPQILVESNAEFVLFETNDDFTDYKKIILNGGNELELQTNILVFDSDYDFEEMLASYENDELHVTFKTEENDCPKYKILRCGIEPENLYSKTEFGTYHPGTIPSARGTIEDNILRLAFDDDYFYVNYEYSDYVSENLLTEDLVIHKGFFNEIEVSGTSVFGVGNITFTNKITVPTGTELVFLPGSHPTLTSTAKFDIYGSVTAVGQPDDKIFFNTNSDWDGFYIQADAGSNFQYCEFENSDDPVRCLGLITMKHCTIKNCTNGLYLQACDTYVVEGNEFYDCVKFGLFVSNINHLIFLGTNSIWNNLLHDNSYGIYLFNTNVKIDSNYVYDNTQIGIIASSGTASIIENCCIQDTYSNNPEIYLVDESYPVIDYRYNDIIFNRGYSIYNADREYELYNCRNNYWGTTTSNYIADSFYPSNWEVYYYPYLVSDTTGFYNSRDISLFEMGLMAEEANQFQLARECYLQCIDESDYEIEKIWAASRLINCVDPENGFTFTDAQQLYETISADTSHIVLSNLAQKQAVNCDRKNGDFQEAIMKYEDMLTDSLSYIDSILVQLNIIHTYFEAESTSGRATLSFKYQENAIRDHEHARQKEASLLDLIREEIIEEGHFTPVIDKSILYNNYPNPFNPETTISFSIPEDSKVGITIYNIKGQKVKTLVSEDLEKGIHKIVWDSKDSSGKSVSSGVYFYKLDVNGKTKGLKKMLLLK